MGEPERAFVLLRHETSDGVHWDLMLDTGASLITWQLAEDPTRLPPEVDPVGEGIPARRLPEHRRAYLDYEGPVSRNRGQVTRVDRGTSWLVHEEPQSYAVKLAGERLTGVFEFRVERAGSSPWRFMRMA
jgi:hypothetical protein